jgi:RNA polymerase sigma-70 factor (ECF subfamily)
MAVTSVLRPASDEASVDLVRRAMDGDPIAFDRLAADRIDRAFRLAVAILGSEADARDAVQDAFVAAWRQLPRLRDPARFGPWLGRIVVNTCRMALRHRRVVRVREVELIEPRYGVDMPDRRTADVESADPVAEFVADADLVHRALGRLDADKRTILILHHAEDLPISEIAAVLDVPVGTVKWRLHAARAALERAVEEEMR